MATLKEVQLKMAAVKKTKQITNAMNMVAASKLRGAQNNMDAFRPYAEKFGEVLGSLSEKAGEESNPLLIPKPDVKKIRIILCTSDRGLCGGFNASLIGMAEKFIKEKKVQDFDFSIINFGKKGRDWARKSEIDLIDEYLGIVGGKFSFNVAYNAGKKLINDFLSESFDEAYIIYASFISMSKHEIVMRKILPIPPLEKKEQEESGDEGYQAEHLCEPDPEELLGELLPRNVYVQIYRALLETSTSEHAARMMAMDNATKACNDMLDELGVSYNKARQASITSDLMDIVGGAEALKG